MPAKRIDVRDRLNINEAAMGSSRKGALKSHGRSASACFNEAAMESSRKEELTAQQFGAEVALQ
jgi:hypothetical protein